MARKVLLEGLRLVDDGQRQVRIWDDGVVEIGPRGGGAGTEYTAPLQRVVIQWDNPAQAGRAP
jgi:hypothetical protein